MKRTNNGFHAYPTLISNSLSHSVTYVTHTLSFSHTPMHSHTNTLLHIHMFIFLFLALIFTITHTHTISHSFSCILINSLSLSYLPQKYTKIPVRFSLLCMFTFLSFIFFMFLCPEPLCSMPFFYFYIEYIYRAAFFLALPSSPFSVKVVKNKNKKT